MRRELLIASGILGLGLAAGLVAVARARTTDDGEADVDAEAGAVEPGAFDSFFASEAGDSVNAEANVRAFLAMIRKAEGTDGGNGYRTIIGGQLFDTYADHPRVKVPFTQTDGALNYSTAAGAYQFLARTWDALAAKLELADFSPENQDRAAVELVRQRGALGLVQEGRFAEAVAKCATIWASLPGSPYPQRTRTDLFVQSAYERAGGTYA